MGERKFRARCYFCRGLWGACMCDWPNPEVSETDEIDGFDHKGFWIVQPNVSTCTRFYVDPEQYYGAAYLAWASDQGLHEGCKAPSDRG